MILMAMLFAVTPAYATPEEGTATEPAGIAEAVRGDSSATGFVADLLHWYDANMNYWAVGGLMAIESSFIPFPSEVVIPPAVYVAANPESRGGMKIWLVVLVGTLGALLGAFINYFLSKFLGRPIVYKFAESRLGHFLLLDASKVEKAEMFFRDHGAISTLVGRLIPAIRQLISIPAGLSNMKILPFALYTAIGATFWNIILAILGYLAHGQKDVIQAYSHELSIGLVGLGVLFIAYMAWNAFKPKKQ